MVCVQGADINEIQVWSEIPEQSIVKYELIFSDGALGNVDAGHEML